MIIGRGLIASAFEKVNNDENLIVFASGISNSGNVTDKDVEREKELLRNTLNGNENNKTLIYFSTYSILNATDANRAYVNHKLNMEKIITDNHGDYLIVRTSNIVGNRGNDATVFRFLFNKVKSSEPFELWSNSVRNFIDVDHLVKMVHEAINRQYNKRILYLVNPLDTKVIDLLNKIEQFTGKKANYNINNDIKNQLSVDKDVSIQLFNDLELNADNYIDQLLDKYYADEKR